MPCHAPSSSGQNELRRELELEPVLFLARRLPARLARVRQSIARYVGAASGDDLGLVPNVTTGLNAVARSIELRRGDEILLTDHEYGAKRILWDEVAALAGAKVVVAHAAAAGAQRGRALRCRCGKVHGAYTRPVREPHHVAERPRPARGPAERARPRARRGLDRRRRSRPWADRPRPPVDRMRHLCRQPAQVGVRAARQRVRLGNPRGAELDPRPGRLLGLVVVRAGGVPGPVRVGRHDRSDRPPLRPRRLPVPARACVAAGAAALQPAGDRDHGGTRGRGRRDPARRRRDQGATDGGLLDPVLGSRRRPAVPVAAPSHRDPGREVLRPARCSASPCRRTRASRIASASSRHCERRSADVGR